MNRKLYLTRAKNIAAERLIDACNAGTISRAEARAKLDKLHAAYRQRVSDIDLADWLAARGLTNIVRNAA